MRRGTGRGLRSAVRRNAASMPCRRGAACRSGHAPAGSRRRRACGGCCGRGRGLPMPRPSPASVGGFRGDARPPPSAWSAGGTMTGGADRGPGKGRASAAKCGYFGAARRPPRCEMRFRRHRPHMVPAKKASDTPARRPDHRPKSISSASSDRPACSFGRLPYRPDGRSLFRAGEGAPTQTPRSVTTSRSGPAWGRPCSARTGGSRRDRPGRRQLATGKVPGGAERLPRAGNPSHAPPTAYKDTPTRLTRWDLGWPFSTTLRTTRSR